CGGPIRSRKGPEGDFLNRDGVTILLVEQNANEAFLDKPGMLWIFLASILIVYCQIDQPGEKMYLMGTRWRVR
ncbi:hypothetical protein HQ520_15855, partial [bacterium]|nr:hypothetical protein [bacterium]